MGQLDHGRLNRLLGDPDLAWVLDRARRRLELGQALESTVVLRAATAAQHDAAARLFGRRPRAAGGLSVSLGELDALLRRSGACEGGLAEAVIALTGSVTVRAARVAAAERAWAEAFVRVEAACAGRPELAAWLTRLRSGGLVKRLAGGSPAAGRELLDALAGVIAALPACGGESLGAFAARVTGRAHALDDGSPLGTLALSAARELGGLGVAGGEESAAESRREGWASVGVLCDELSSMVLTLGLPGDRSRTGAVLAAAGANAGSGAGGGAEPVWLTLRTLVRNPPRWRVGRLERVLVVENPSVVALAADAVRAGQVPLVCTNGQPRAATMVLLRSLAAAGVRPLHHGDFDWGGLAIGNFLQRRLPIEPWQFDSASYLRAVAAHPHAAPLSGAPVACHWDPALTEAMVSSGIRVEEELLARELLQDLA